MKALVAGIIFICLSIVAGTAHAHSELMRTAPSEGAVLASPPQAITLTFNEPIAPLVLSLLGPGGKLVPLGQPEVHDSTLSVPLPPQSQRGSYLFSWRIASADGHPVGGTLSFAIGAPDSHAPVAAPPYRAPGLYPVIAITAVALLAGLLFGIGGMAFDAWATQYDPGGCRKHLPALLLAAVAGPISLGLQGLDALGAPWSAIATSASWHAAMSTSYGLLVWTAEAAVLMALFACATGSARWRRVLALLSVLLLGASLASSGHAATATAGNAARIAVFLHIMAVVAWLGALACLPVLLRAGYGDTPLRRFSTAAVGIVVLLVATGMLLAWWQLREPADLWRTAYGRILTAKLLLVLGLLALGAVNRWRWTGATLRGDMGALRLLVRNTRWETVLAIGILCAVALWRFTPPPRALPQDMSMHHSMSSGSSMAMGSSKAMESPMVMGPSKSMESSKTMDSSTSKDSSMTMSHSAAADQTASPARAASDRGWPMHLHGAAAKAEATVVFKPNGHARVMLTLTHDDDTPLQAKEVSVTFSMERMGIEGIVRPAHPSGQEAPASAWTVDDVPLLVPGSWTVGVNALITDFDSISLQGQGNVGAENPAPR
ncbi:MAG TPA: copper resistance protein CopC [Bordetella sp.]|nr:copper resistance protein CopC [Bordetella sp.]